MFQYKVYAPSPPLQPFVSSYAVVENTVAITHQILPHAGLTLGIQYRGRMEISTKDPAIFEGYASGLMGIQDAYRTMRRDANSGMLAINFTEAGAGAFFKVPLHELYNIGVTLDLLVPASVVSRLEEQIAGAATADEKVRIADAFLFSLLGRQGRDPLIVAALEIIRDQQGIIRSEALAKQLCISPSRLEKRFRQAVGVSPKKFASMVRIESLIKSYQNNSLLTQLAYDAGYFDQAHFNRDFKAYTGLSPRQLFGDSGQTPGDVQQACGLIYGGDVPPVQAEEL